MNFKCLIFILLVNSLFVATSFSMKRPLAKPVDISMVKINKWEDAKPFAGRIVAYIPTRSNKYSRIDEWGELKGYPINNDPQIKYGYISHYPIGTRDGDGYDLFPFLHTEENEPVFSRLLTDPYLKKASIAMRLANNEEINKIREALNSGKATFESRGDFEYDTHEMLGKLAESEQKLKNIPPVPSMRDLSIDAALKQIRSGQTTLENLKRVLPKDIVEDVEKRYLQSR